MLAIDGIKSAADDQLLYPLAAPNELGIYALATDLIICCLKADLNNFVNRVELLSASSIKRVGLMRVTINHFNVTAFHSCVADNSLGRTKKYIEVSGRPGPAEFLSPTYSGHLDRYNLTFKIESIPLLEEIKLLYRKLMVSRTKCKKFCGVQSTFFCSSLSV